MSTIKLDWTQLLAFDQAPATEAAGGVAPAADPRRLGTKVGGKSGNKPNEIQAEPIAR